MNLDAIRRKIDALDTKIVALLNRRLALAAAIGRLKRRRGDSIYVAEREDQVLRKVRARNRGPLKDAALRAIYREVMSASIALEKPLLIAYLGPKAASTHEAAMKKFGASVNYRALTTVGGIFTAVEKGKADYGVIPIENSAGRSVRDALDAFVDSDLKIVAQIHLDDSGAAMRFFVIGRRPSGRVGGGRDLTGFLVSLGDKEASHSGALLHALAPLAGRGAILAEIGSGPSKKRPEDHYVFVEVTGHHDDLAVQAAVKRLRKRCPLVKWLGSYPSAS